MPIFQSFLNKTLSLKTYRIPANLADIPALFANYQGGKPLVFESTEKNRRYRIHRTSLQNFTRQLFTYVVKIDLAGIEGPVTGTLTYATRFGSYNLYADAANPPDSIYLKAFVKVSDLRLAILPVHGMTDAQKRATLPAFHRLAAFNFETDTLNQLRGIIMEILRNYHLLLHLVDLNDKHKDNHFHFDINDLEGPVTETQVAAYNYLKLLFT